MRRRGFTLMEMVIVVAIIGAIALVAVPSFSGIQRRSTINADKLTGAQIGKAFIVKETDAGNLGTLVNTQVKYNGISGVGSYVSDQYKPESMEDGFYVITQVEVSGTKYLMVGISKNDIGGNQQIIPSNKIYNGDEEPGWVWCQWGDIDKFIEENSDKIEWGGGETDVKELFTIEVSSNADGGITPSTNQNVLQGASATFYSESTIEDDNKIYQFDHWLVDGANAGDAENYTFENVQADHTIRAVYTEVEKQKLTVGISDVMQIETYVAPGEKFSINTSDGSFEAEGLGGGDYSNGVEFEMPDNDVTVMQ